MDERAAKLALARKKLKDHQDKKNLEHKCEPNAIDHKNEVSLPDLNATVNENSSTVDPDINPSHHHYSMEIKNNESIKLNKSEINATEFLISSKRNLEMQLIELQDKYTKLENNFLTTFHNNETSSQKIIALETELKNLSFHHNTALEQSQRKDILIKELHDWKNKTIEEKTDLQEQLEFTKTILGAKETENDSLRSQLFNIQEQLDATQLQLQQLTSGSSDAPDGRVQENLKQDNEILRNKVTNLEQQLKSQLKDYQQINSHYEHYVGELNDQLKTVTRKNEDLNRELQNLSNRENSLIEQISEMEIRIQNYNRTAFDTTVSTTNNSCNTKDFEELKEKYEKTLDSLQQRNVKYQELENLYKECTAKMQDLNTTKEIECKQTDEVSLQKLNADITSDKLAAQRAAEQNKKLKQDMQGLEEAVLKMTKDKLELTEKIAAEKYLNRELTIKLSEIDEKANNLQTTLKAKDEEMMRLQVTYRKLEQLHEELKQSVKSDTSSEQLNNNIVEKNSESIEGNNDSIHYHRDECEHKLLTECSSESASIPKGDAMVKLQERFLKIMGEVADLSDEKHRLEHIIMQLQNETDTICEYVALYQQQRSLLKKRDEERSAQIKLFQTECNRLQTQLDELTDILKRFADDKELSSYFQIQTKHEDIEKVMSLLSNLKTSSILDPKKTIEFNNFYPCSCCSGQLIEV